MGSSISDCEREPYIYIAGPFFNKEQIEIIDTIRAICNVHTVEHFSPKDECLFEKGKTTPQEILDMNIKALNDCTHIIVVTDGKDVGTMFEAGFAYAVGINIIYAWLGGKPEDKFNLMLAASGRVARSYEQLDEMIEKLYSDPGLDFQKDMNYE